MRRSSPSLWVALLLPLPLVILGACRARTAAPAGSAGRAHQGSAAAQRSPRTQKELPTTAPEIALGNLDGQLDGMVRALGDRPTPAVMASLATLYLAHGRILGRIADYERADTLTERALRLAPGDPQVLLARASALQTFHRFVDAQAILDRAASAGASANAVDGQRASILAALGRFAEARPIRERMAREHPTLETLGALAALDGDEGRLDEAERGYAEALDHFPDVSPFPLAWLWLQQGTLWQREGRPARARELLQAAVERLPQLAPAAGHLAALEAEQGARDRAEALLRKLVETSDDPEYTGQLAALLRAAGSTGEADGLSGQAHARFDELVGAHPVAFADHAARFFLEAGPGRNPQRALTLAELNFAVRHTAEAALLLIEAASAAGARAHACDVAELLVTLAPRSVPLHHAAWRTLRSCDRDARAADVLRRAEELGKGR